VSLSNHKRNHVTIRSSLDMNQARALISVALQRFIAPHFEMQEDS